MTRRLLVNFVTALCLLLGVACIGLWLRSQSHGEGWELPPRPTATPPGRRLLRNSDGWWTLRLLASIDGRLVYASFETEWVRWPGTPHPRTVSTRAVTTDRRSPNRINPRHLRSPRPDFQNLRRWSVPGIAEYRAFPTQIIPPPGAPPGEISGGVLVEGTRYFSLAWWVIALPPLLLPAVRGGRWLLRRRHDGPTRCATCGYDLRATRDRCPECGTAVHPRTSADQDLHPPPVITPTPDVSSAGGPERPNPE